MHKISILGLGLIGGSLAKALKNSGKEFEIIGFDKEPVLEEAFKQKIIDAKINSPEESLDSEVIFLCLPTDLSLEYFRRLSPKLKKGTILSDVCGVKGIFEDEWKKIKSEGFYVGGHLSEKFRKRI